MNNPTTTHVIPRSLAFDCRQCDQIGRFIVLWASFYSLGQQLICPQSPTFLGNFVKVSKSIIFPMKSFLGNFYTRFFLVTLAADNNIALPAYFQIDEN